MTTKTAHKDSFDLDDISSDVQARLLSVLKAKDKTISGQQNKINSLQHQLDWFKRQVFGQKSEKRDMEDNPYQTTISDLLSELPEIPKALEEDKTTVSYQRGKAKKNGLEGSPDDSGLRFDKTVPVVEIQIAAPELEGDDKDDYEVISYKTTYRLAQRPGSSVVLKYVRPVIKKKSTQELKTTPVAGNVFDKSIADVSFLVGMLIDKFLYHLPLYRQHQRLEDSGIVLARSTLTNLVKRSISLLQPIYEEQLKNVIRSRVLAIDETPVKAGREKKGKLKQAYFWPIFGDMDEICFTFSNSRKKQHLEDMLGDFKGVLLSDGYSAYDSYVKKCAEATLAQCWVHTRRKFDESLKSEPEQSAIALAYIGKIYEAEKEIKKQKLTGQKKKNYRQQYSKPAIDAFFSWCYDQRQRIDLVKTDPLSVAINYAQNRENELRVFLDDPEVSPDTNHVERSLRVIPMGKKNWLFAWTEIGAEHIGIIQSLIVTCRIHKVNPYDYLVDVLQRVDSHPASKVHELTPRIWKEKFGDNPLRSDLFLHTTTAS